MIQFFETFQQQFETTKKSIHGPPNSTFHSRPKSTFKTPFFFFFFFFFLLNMGLRKDREQKKAAPSIKTNKFFIIVCSFLVLNVVYRIVQESKNFDPVEQSLRGNTEALIDIDTEYAASHVNESMAELKEANSKITDLQKQLEQLKEDSESAQKQLEQLKEDSESAQTALALASASNTSSVVFDPSNVCSVFPSPGAASATRLWKEYLPAIFEASKNPAMKEEEVAKLREIIEETLSPARMRRAIQHLPTFSQHILKHVMGIVQKRLADPDNNPPLRIAVFGGSVTSGRGCPQPYCDWPKRFELLVNQFFGGREIIKIVNLAVGGTNSGTGTKRIKYWMYGSDAEMKRIGPDVIINSYSTNESLPPWDKKWPEDDLISIVREQVHSRLQDLIREALQSKPCQVPPLVVHVDDYLGPQQPVLMGELAYVSEMTQLAKVRKNETKQFKRLLQTDGSCLASQNTHCACLLAPKLFHSYHYFI
jgi:hypothetical protein